jgi:hypothetical protein
MNPGMTCDIDPFNRHTRSGQSGVGNLPRRAGEGQDGSVVVGIGRGIE